MPRRCCVGGCNSNYGTENENVKVHRFPSDPDEKKRWINALVDILSKELTQDMFVCIEHWSSNYQTFNKKGHQIPVDPPSIFSGPSSFAPQTRRAPRKLKDRKIERESGYISHSKKNRAGWHYIIMGIANTTLSWTRYYNNE